MRPSFPPCSCSTASLPGCSLRLAEPAPLEVTFPTASLLVPPLSLHGQGQVRVQVSRALLTGPGQGLGQAQLPSLQATVLERGEALQQSPASHLPPPRWPPLRSIRSGTWSRGP